MNDTYYAYLLSLPVIETQAKAGQSRFGKQFSRYTKAWKYTKLAWLWTKC